MVGCPTLNFSLFGLLKYHLRLRFFLLLTKQNKILTRDNLSKRGWILPHNCVLCLHDESVNYLFVVCHIANMTDEQIEG